MPAHYITPDLRTLTIAALAHCDAPAILFVKLTSDGPAAPPVRAYLLTPILYAALERHTDLLDAHALFGKLSGERLATVASRLEAIRRAASERFEFGESGSIEKARCVLRPHSDALALGWVLNRYVDRMGGEDAVSELERAAVRGDPWERYRELDVIAAEKRIVNDGGDDSDGERCQTPDKTNWPVRRPKHE